jgi:hypothetical protein
MSDVWLRCSACKKEIRFGAMHWVCSVSTCNRNRMRQVFCTVPCWDSHVADARHRDAWAVEARAPSREAWAKEQADAQQADARAAAAPPRPAGGEGASGAPMIRRHVVNEPPRSGPPPASFTASATGAGSGAPSGGGAAPTLAEAEREILIVVSKLKKYIRDRSGFNTSDSVMDMLSDHVRAICDQAIRTAATDGRKTVLDRDVPRVPRG